MYHAIFFGGQLTEIGIEELQYMRRYITSKPNMRVLYDAMIDFEQYGERLEVADPELKKIETLKTSSLFSSWMQGDGDAAISNAVSSHSNAVASALTVLHQVLLVIKYTESHPSAIGQKFIQPETTLEGLCVGKLAATVIRLSWGDAEMAKTLANALRLAFCIGAYVDLDRYRLGSRAETECLVIKGTDTLALEQLEKILLEYDDVRATCVVWIWY